MSENNTKITNEPIQLDVFKKHAINIVKDKINYFEMLFIPPPPKLTRQKRVYFKHQLP